ncbi:hypothetical protein UB46_42965 [Burkholderiaceae bacterium 16]|nr:hypothetical protein UB46_42965 [Burkholderiaceae bacterium 16]
MVWLDIALLPAYAASLTSGAICPRPLESDPPHVELLLLSRSEPHSVELDGLLSLVREQVASM